MDDLDRHAREYAGNVAPLGTVGWMEIVRHFKVGARSRDEEVAQIKSRFNELDLCQKGEAPCAYAVQLNEQIARLTAPEPDGISRFAGKVLRAHRHDGGSDVGGDDIQDWALECGLLESRNVTEPCGDKCWCAEFDDFPRLCYVPTAAGRAALGEDTKGDGG